MHKTVYTCDICKKEKEEKEIKNLGINSPDISFYGSSYSKNFEICTDCLKEKGVNFEPKPLKNLAEENTKALGDKIVDILADLGVRFYE